MAVPNFGPELPDPMADDARKGNPAHAYGCGAVLTASSRAVSVTHRFGGVRHALTGPTPPGGESDPSE